jgi:hypothetical protein
MPDGRTEDLPEGGCHMDIVRLDGMKLELWVKDEGAFDGFAVYFDDDRISRIVDQQTHVYPIPPQEASLKIAVQFGGSDGGISAVVDVVDGNNQVLLGNQQGTRHEYVIKKGP